MNLFNFFTSSHVLKRWLRWPSPSPFELWRFQVVQLHHGSWTWPVPPPLGTAEGVFTWVTWEGCLIRDSRSTVVLHVKSCVFFCNTHLCYDFHTENCSHFVFAWIAARRLLSKTADARPLDSWSSHGKAIGELNIHPQQATVIASLEDVEQFIFKIQLPCFFVENLHIQLERCTGLADIQCCRCLIRQDEQLLWIAEHAMNAEPQSLEIFDLNCENDMIFHSFCNDYSCCMFL